MRLKLISIIGLLVLLGCSNIQIEQRAFVVTPPDEDGLSQVSGRIQYRSFRPDEIQYEIVNASTKEKVSGKIRGDELLGQKIKAIEGDKICITLKDKGGDYTYKSFTIPEVPLQEKLVRMGYTKAEALEYMKYLAMVDYQKQQIKAQKNAAIASMAGAILAAGAAQNQRQQNWLYQQQQSTLQPLPYQGPLIYQRQGGMGQGMLINPGTGQANPVMVMP